MPLPRGSSICPYEIVLRLGAGGMGEVYRARDPRLGREVAIKVLLEGAATDPHLVEDDSEREDVRNLSEAVRRSLAARLRPA